MVENDGVEILRTVFSNVLLAIAKPILASGAFIISPVAGPSQLAGKQCDGHFFSVRLAKTTRSRESIAIEVAKEKIPDIYFMAPNYPGGRDQLARTEALLQREHHRGLHIPSVTRLLRRDCETPRQKPHGVLFFYPGGMGINFVKQFAQSEPARQNPALYERQHD